MFIPIGTDRPQRRGSLIVPALIALNTAVFLADVVVTRLAGADSGALEEIHALLALRPDQVRPWALVTYAFLHGGFMHLLFNMVFLWVFGPNVEDRFGRGWFLAFYLAGGAAAGALHAVFEESWVIGASGSIAAVTGAYLVLFPRTRIRVLCLLVIFGVFAVPAWWFIAGRIVWDLLSQGSGRAGNVAVLAHLGGYGFGIGVAMFLLWRRILEREPWDLFSIARQAGRRRAIREAALGSETRLRRKVEKSRPAKTGPAKTGSAKTGSAKTGSAKTGSAKTGPAEAGEADLAEARAGIGRCVAAGDLEGAAERYRALLSRFGSGAGPALLSRRTQYDLANHFFARGDHQTAAVAYELFLEGYPKDPESPVIRLMLGRINAVYLNDPVRARRLLTDAVEELTDEASVELARRHLADLG